MSASGGEAQPIKLLLTPEEAAQAIGVSRARIYELLGQREIPSLKVGRSRRVPVSVLQGWIARELAEQCGDDAA